jgi:predicted ATPase
MISVQDFREMLILRRVMREHQMADNVILVFGFCHECSKYVVNSVRIKDDEDAREAFLWFFESLEIDCKLAHNGYEKLR